MDEVEGSAREMRPDRMGKSKWVKLRPWYYTAKRQRSRHAVLSEAVADEVTVNPKVRFGKPAVNGISVDAICEQHESGASIEEIARDYGLSVAGVASALAWRYGNSVLD